MSNHSDIIGFNTPQEQVEFREWMCGKTFFGKTDESKKMLFTIVGGTWDENREDAIIISHGGNISVKSEKEFWKNILITDLV